MKLNITFTGIDHNTCFDALNELVAGTTHHIEIGFLLNIQHQGSQKRYPTLEWIEDNITKLPNTSLHICGRESFKLLSDFKLNNIIQNTQRIQLNGSYCANTIDDICIKYQDHQIITQYTGSNLQTTLDVSEPNHAILLDNSGGKGILRDNWSPIDTVKPVGFAGGLGPTTLRLVWNYIKPHISNSSWLDMENRIRTNDYFCVHKIDKVISFLTP